jgi:hypothetical protein
MNLLKTKTAYDTILNKRCSTTRYGGVLAVLLTMLIGLTSAQAQEAPKSAAAEVTAPAAAEPMQIPKALRETKFAIQFRTMYLDRNKYDDSESESWAMGGSAGLITGYFFEHLALGVTGYTSQHLYGDDDKDGALLLKPDQESYSVIGEIYGDGLLYKDVHAYFGRKAYDTPYINRNDVRMTPNTFEAIAVQGRASLGAEGEGLNYDVGYVNKIKERNSDRFVPMSQDAGSSVDRGVYMVGGTYQKGVSSFSAYDYYSQDIINILYAEAKHTVPLTKELALKLGVQYADQQSTGDDLLSGDDFSTHQFGVKAELALGGAAFTVGYTDAANGYNMQNPWSGCPSYTSVQVEDFNRAGEEAFILRAAYAFSDIKGLSAYGLWVNGTSPHDPAQYKRDEYDLNLQWAASDGMLKGLGLRARYAQVKQDGDFEDLTDLRFICTYDLNW